KFEEILRRARIERNILNEEYGQYLVTGNYFLDRLLDPAPLDNTDMMIVKHHSAQFKKDVKRCRQLDRERRDLIYGRENYFKRAYNAVKRCLN
ncbi:MAG: hypothetical protein Q8O89_02460, partial [Nanoarchaeota archaeon]|nr:hypothetical protein [Nanoarchaeota archaeon]